MKTNAMALELTNGLLEQLLQELLCIMIERVLDNIFQLEEKSLKYKY